MSAAGFTADSDVVAMGAAGAAAVARTGVCFEPPGTAALVDAVLVTIFALAFAAAAFRAGRAVRKGAVDAVASLGSAAEGVSVAAVADEVVSAGAVSTGVASVAGAGWLVAGLGSAETGCASCARSGVEESARAAAIAGSALVRRCFVLFDIMGKNTHGGRSGPRFTVTRAETATSRQSPLPSNPAFTVLRHQNESSKKEDARCPRASVEQTIA